MVPVETEKRRLLMVNNINTSTGIIVAFGRKLD